MCRRAHTADTRGDLGSANLGEAAADMNRIKRVRSWVFLAIAWLASSEAIAGSADKQATFLEGTAGDYSFDLRDTMPTADDAPPDETASSEEQTSAKSGAVTVKRSLIGQACRSSR